MAVFSYQSKRAKTIYLIQFFFHFRQKKHEIKANSHLFFFIIKEETEKKKNIHKKSSFKSSK